MKTLRTALLTFSLVAAGCATFRPLPLIPEVELAKLREVSLVEFSSSNAHDRDSEKESSAFDLSDGLNEAEVVAVALRLNPELKAKRATVGEAEAFLITAGQWPNPDVGFDVRNGISGGVGLSVEGDLLFELLWPEKRSARQGAAEANVEKVHAEILAEEWRVVASVRYALIGVLAAEHFVRLFDEEVLLREHTLALVEKRKEIGEGNQLDVMVADLELATVKRELRSATTELGETKRVLNRQLGLPPEYSLQLTESNKPIKIATFEDIDNEALEQRVLEGRYELKAKMAEYLKVEQELRLAVAKQYPGLRIGPSLESNDEGTSLGLGVGIELPIFNQNQGEIAKKESERLAVRAAYVSLLHSLLADACEARVQLLRAKQEVELQRAEVLPLVEKTAELYQEALRTNELSVFDWVAAQQRVLSIQREYLRALVAYQKAVITLETATGVPISQHGG